MVPVDLLNYQLIRLIGRGGMGEVYLARNKNIEQYVAVKALHPKYANSAMLRARFKQEAVMLNSLNHPNIVKFLNFVENEYGVFLIMEYVEGLTLEDYITKKSGLIVEQKAYPMITEILQAFSYAHQRGIIHRDIKPSNIFIDKEGHIKVMDFGIAQILSEVDNSERSWSSAGTPAYMSPEQVYGQPLDQRSDIYSLGVLFHQMLTGRTPYDSTTMSEHEIKGHVVNERLPRMKSYYPYISDGLQAVVDKATAKEQSARYSTCDEMLKAIKKVLDPEKKSLLPLYIGGAVAAVVLLIGLGLWDYFRTKVDYYKDYAEFYGVPKGIGSLSSREMRHRQMSYAFEKSRWKVRRVTLVNAYGKPIRHHDTEHINSRFTDVYYYYNDNGKVDYKKVYDEYGDLLYKIDYDENLKVAMFKHDDEHGTAKRLQSNTTELHNINTSAHSSITRHLLTYNDRGLLEKVEYASGEDNTRVGDTDNIYGQAYSYDDKGRIVEVCFLGQDGRVHGNKIGLAIKQYEYDKNDDWTKVSYLTADRKPSHDGNNCPVVKIEYDKWGNRIGEHYFTFNGKPSFRTDVSACGFCYEYDDHGCLLTQGYINGEGQLITNNYGFAQVKWQYNENGYATRMEFFDKDGKRTNNIGSDGEVYSKVEMVVDERGLILSNEQFDTKDRRLENSHGVHQFKCQYDSVGHLIRIDYFDKDLRPARYDGANSSVRHTFNNLGQHESMSCYDKDGNLTYNQDGVARYQYTYDNSGNVTKYEYIDKDGKTLVNSHEGFAVQKITYDVIGNIKTVHHYNRSMEPCMSSYGYYAKEFVYDENTNFMTEEKYYNAKKQVISINRYAYDDNGNLTASWTVNGQGVLQGEVTHYERDGSNRITRKYLTNLSGKKVNLKGASYCDIRYTHDDRGNIIEQTVFNESGKPAIDELKTHKRYWRYDERNNRIYEKNIGKDGKPLRGTDVNPEGKVEYDDHNNMTAIECYDGYGNRYTSSLGFFREEFKYNENNLLESQIYLNTKLQMVNLKGTDYAKVTYTYDTKRNRIKDKYFDSNGSMHSYVEYSYNAQNSMTEACMYDANDRLDAKKNGFSRMTISYQFDGVTPIKRTYYKGKTVLAWNNYDAKSGKWGPLNF